MEVAKSVKPYMGNIGQRRTSRRLKDLWASVETLHDPPKSKDMVKTKSRELGN